MDTKKLFGFISIAMTAVILSGCTPRAIGKGIMVAKSVGSERLTDSYSKRQARQVCSIPMDSMIRLYGDNPTRLNALMAFCGYNLKAK